MFTTGRDRADSARDPRASLAATFLVAGALLCAVWSFADRGPSTSEPGGARAPADASAGVARMGVAKAHPAPELEPAPALVRTPVEAEARRESPEVAATATISGRLQIDGFAPYHASVRLKDGGGWDRAAPIDPYGRFHVEGVPAARLSLSFEAAGLEARKVLLPNELELTPAAGEIEFVDLDWKTRQLNVRVVDGDEPPGRARVDVEGPSYRASFDTSERGKAELSLVGSGLFSFRAELSSGRRGETTVELDEDSELDTVVIATERD
jgi:hypothetical protein